MNSGFDFATCSLDMLRMSIVKDLEGMRSGEGQHRGRGLRGTNYYV